MKNLIFILLCILSINTVHAQTDEQFNAVNKMNTFDIKIFNEKSINGTYEFETDSSRVKQIKYFDNYVEYIHPKGKFYDMYNVYYPNGNIKEHGLRITGLKIGKWEFYDELENVTIVDEDAKFAGFDYNVALRFLHKKGFINLDTGDGAGNFTIGFNSDKKRWKVEAKDNNEQWRLYTLTGKTGRVISVKDIKWEE